MKQAGKLTCDDGGCGDAHLVPSFLSYTPLCRAGVLHDWIYDLINEYNRARKQLGWRPVTLSATDGSTEDEIARECVGNGMGDSDVCRLIAEALRAEREACAQIAFAHEKRALKAGSSTTAGWCLDIAAAIRARGETT